MLSDDTGTRAFRAIWKVITGRNVTDNYDLGEAGNLLAAIEFDTGRIERVVRGFGVRQEQLSRHPDTGEALLGAILPDWRAALDMVTRAGRLFPMVPFQHWDIALTDSGPVVLEVNTTGGTNILQWASGRGLYDEEMRAFVARHARA